MKAFIALVSLMIGVSLHLQAQEEVTTAAKEACSCLEELNPETLSKSDLKIEIFGCMSSPVDGIAEALKKRNAWSDTLVFKYLGLVGKEVRSRCPEQLERLKKKDISIDSAMLKMKPGSKLLPAYSQAVCNCMSVSKDLEDCMKTVGEINEEEIIKQLGEKEALSGIMALAMDVMFELADNCDAAAQNETIAQLKKFPPIQKDCNTFVLGEFSTETMLGETRSKFTATKLQEFTDGKLTSEYTLKWEGCTVIMKCLKSDSPMIKKGDETAMEIKRASAEGFIGSITFGKMHIPATYKKTK